MSEIYFELMSISKNRSLNFGGFTVDYFFLTDSCKYSAITAFDFGTILQIWKNNPLLKSWNVSNPYMFSKGNPCHYILTQSEIVHFICMNICFVSIHVVK